MESRAEEQVFLQIEGPMATVVINNPPANSLSRSVYRALDRVIDELEHNTDIRVCILTGNGEKVFVGGADIAECATFDQREMKEYIALNRRVFGRLERVRFPVLCALNGHAFGGGCELALACDIRIARKGIKIGQPEVTVGVIPGSGGTQRLLQLIPKGKALWMMMSGLSLDGAEAERVGLIDIVAEGEVMVEAKKLALRIADNAPLAVSAVKKLVYDKMNERLDEGLQLEAQVIEWLNETEDAKEGYQAFLEKRPPRFKGK